MGSENNICIFTIKMLECQYNLPGAWVITPPDNTGPDASALGPVSFLGGAMADKVFKTYKEQCEILRQRGMIIKSPARFYAAMKQDDYYNVINGYKKYFIATFDPEQYIAGTTFDHIYALYSFDQTVRRIIFPVLLAVEKSVKSIIAYQFSSVYGHDHTRYLVPANFKTDARNIRHTINTISKIQKTIIHFQSSNNAAIVHYLTNYGYIPLWVANSVLSFGEIAHFFDCLKLQDQQAIASCFSMTAATLNGALFLLADYRNTCAHGSRLYTTNISSGARHHLPNTKFHSSLNLPVNSTGNYRKGKMDILALFIALKLFSSKSNFTKAAKDFLRAEQKLVSSIPPDIMQNIDSEMGSPLQYVPTLISL